MFCKILQNVLIPEPSICRAASSPCAIEKTVLTPVKIGSTSGYLFQDNIAICPIPEPTGQALKKVLMRITMETVDRKPLERIVMLRETLLFFLIAPVAALPSFSGIVASAGAMALVLFFAFPVFVVALISGRMNMPIDIKFPASGEIVDFSVKETC